MIPALLYPLVMEREKLVIAQEPAQNPGFVMYPVNVGDVHPVASG
jgi:hypothetical protein